MKRWVRSVLGIAAAILVAAYVIYGGGRHEGPGTVTATPLAPAVVSERLARQRELAPGTGRPAKQILFGDLHVHSTFSADAFMRSLPLVNGEGAHPPADACDFARYCSGLDFFSMNDHAEALTAEHWQETKETVRQCNAVAGDPQNPDLVAFIGWEWSQVGITPETHYGHKNVIFRDLRDDQVPARPIGAPGLQALFEGGTGSGGSNRLAPLTMPLLEFPRRQRYLDFGRYQRELRAMRDCPAGVDTRSLPAGCRETAATPAELFEKLNQWGFPTLVIPHGSTWGFYTPAGYAWDKQLAAAQRNDRQRLIEVFSGHGNSEEYRTWHEVVRGPDGALECPDPSPNYEPCCWRAGQIIQERCAGTPPGECERRVREARKNYVAAGLAGQLTVPGATLEDWKDCGQCRDCFQPAFNFRPGGSVQYILARGGFERPAQPVHETFGFIASSDNHSARPGTGYKEYARRKMTEATGARDARWRERFFGSPDQPTPESLPVQIERLGGRNPWQIVPFERQASFFLTGGLAAVHADGRSRDAIWSALERREAYGTSGPRILLWFDVLNAPSGRQPMGSEVTLAGPPRFVVSAVGDFRQKKGCPPWSAERLGAERLAHLCAGECYNPDDERYRITRIEVVRIRRQRTPEEPVAGLIEDAWRRLDCPPGTGACRVEFEDTDFASAARDTVYYVRAIQEPTLAVNAASVRCERDAEGHCLRAKPCYGDYRTSFDDDCLAQTEERAWSSPIFVHFASATEVQ